MAVVWLVFGQGVGEGGGLPVVNLFALVGHVSLATARTHANTAVLA